MKAGRTARRLLWIRKQVVKHVPQDGHVDGSESKNVQSLITEAEQRPVKSRSLQGSKEGNCVQVTFFSTPAPAVR